MIKKTTLFMMVFSLFGGLFALKTASAIESITYTCSPTFQEICNATPIENGDSESTATENTGTSKSIIKYISEQIGRNNIYIKSANYDDAFNSMRFYGQSLIKDKYYSDILIGTYYDSNKTKDIEYLENTIAQPTALLVQKNLKSSAVNDTTVSELLSSKYVYIMKGTCLECMLPKVTKGKGNTYFYKPDGKPTTIISSVKEMDNISEFLNNSKGQNSIAIVDSIRYEAIKKLDPTFASFAIKSSLTGNPIYMPIFVGINKHSPIYQDKTLIKNISIGLQNYKKDNDSSTTQTIQD